MIGKNLGPYKIIERIGAGAMGQVYRAQDERLERSVAIKVLPRELAGEHERLRRFEREARAAAALNHPHIAVVFDIGCETSPTSGSVEQTGDPAASEAELHFIVQEFLAGENLRLRLERRPISLDESIRLGIEIASALHAAHEVGIVHRDLKPENILITDSGHAKILDFGLAKLIQDDYDADGTGRPAAVSDSIAGRVMGTPGYMAPEQVNGEASDARSDIFAFGALLYEMVAGAKAFDGRSAAECMSRLVHEEPEDLVDIDPTLPVELHRILGKCLHKDPRRRYQGAADLEVDLRALRRSLGTPTALPLSTMAPPGSGDIENRFGRFGLPVALAAGVLGAILASTLMPETAPTAAPIMRFSVDLPPAASITRTERQVVAMSPDGQRIVVAAGGGLWTRALSSESFSPIPGSASSSAGVYAVAPAISPDGSEVVFFLDGFIRKTPLAGGATVSVTPANDPSTIHWADDGNIYYTQADPTEERGRVFVSEGIWNVPENGGAGELIVRVDPDRRAAAPQLLPGNEWLLFSTTSASEFVLDDSSTERVMVQSTRTGERRELLEDGFSARYVRTGHIIFLRDTGLWAVPFNLDGLTVSAGATEVLESVPASYWSGTAYVGISEAGTLVVPSLARLEQRNGTLSWVEPSGALEDLGLPLADNPRVSADGKTIVAEVRDVGRPSIFVHEVDSGSWSELTDGASGSAPVLSHDGRWVYYTAPAANGDNAVWRKRADLSGRAEELWRPTGHVPYPESIAADGSFLIYSAALVDQNDIWMLPLGEDDAVPLTDTPDISEEGTQVHPSGRWIAYTASRADGYVVFVQELNGDRSLGRRYEISDPGAAEPMWSRDGETLYYRAGAQLVAVPCTLEPTFRGGQPRVVLREFPGDSPVLRADYDVDGSGRFLTAIPVAEWNGNRLDIIVNWFAQANLR